MIDHITLPVSNFQKSVGFYTAALAPLGYVPGFMVPKKVQAFHVNGKPEFWIAQSKSKKFAPTHLAFAANEVAIQQFYDAAIAAGGKDNGEPGPREGYHKGYFAAYVLDLDGHNIEVVTHVHEPLVPGESP